MGVKPAFVDLATAVREAARVVATGAGTHAGIGGPVTDATEVRAPVGIVGYEPADMTVTVRAGTGADELDATLAGHGQECPLDPTDPAATVGGTIATGLSGWRRLGLGPLRDTVLEVVLVLADGRVVRGGGPTVKNVTGYDIPRLVVGSLGTLGVIAQVTLRTRPRPRASQWFRAPDPPTAVRNRLFAPTAVLHDGTDVMVLIEGHPDDVASEAARAGLRPGAAPTHPHAAHGGRISVTATALDAVEAELATIPDLSWLAEHAVGTVHVASASPAGLDAARRVAAAHGGWLLREWGAPDLDPFGAGFPAPAVQQRIRATLDPTAKLSPGRVTATEPTAAIRISGGDESGGRA